MALLAAIECGVAATFALLSVGAFLELRTVVGSLMAVMTGVVVGLAVRNLLG